MNELEKYTRKVARNLRVDRKTKRRILEGLTAEFAYALSGGETEAEILTRMGPARAVAADYNASYREDRAYQTARKRALAQKISVASLLAMPAIIAFGALQQQYTADHTSVSGMGAVMGPMRVETAAAPITWLDQMGNSLQNAQWAMLALLAVFVFSAAYYMMAKKQ